MCPHLMQEHILEPWISLFKTLLDMPVHEEVSSFTEDTNEIMSRNKHVIWKIKGIISQITYMLFLNYMNAESLKSQYSRLRIFADNFTEKFTV